MAKKKPGAAPGRDGGLASGLTGKHRKTLEAIFARPDRSNIVWNDFLKLMEAVGATVITEGGSAHYFELRGASLNIHKPHPGHELYKEYVRKIRGFLRGVRLTP